VTGAIYDFHAGHPDFQCGPPTYPDFVDAYGKDCGPWDPAIVCPLGSLIGADRKPVYLAADRTPSTTGATNFAEWYRETPGVNLMSPLTLTLGASGGSTYVYETDRFFPIDGQLFAADPDDQDNDQFHDEDGQAHNYHFTYELHTTFRYDVGNVFTFRGDDDVFVYINDRLVINLGGIHVPVQGSIALDTGRVEIIADMPPAVVAPDADLGLPEAIQNGAAGTVQLDLTPGEVYPMDFFFAERNCCGSNFRVETNLVFVSCGEPPN
jgi:fibro-slime domain-containing protein